MKIVVYAICKNEEQFVDRWMDSMSEADEIVVLAAGRIAARGHKDEVLPKLLETGSSVKVCEGKVEANA